MPSKVGRASGERRLWNGTSCDTQRNEEEIRTEGEISSTLDMHITESLLGAKVSPFAVLMRWRNEVDPSKERALKNPEFGYCVVRLCMPDIICGSFFVRVWLSVTLYANVSRTEILPSFCHSPGSVPRPTVRGQKTIELKDVETHEQYEFLLNEIEILKQLDHPNIAR